MAEQRGDGRDRILAATLSMLARRTSGGISVSEVSTRASVSRSTVYHHFGDKVGLLQAVGLHVADIFKDALLAAVRAQPDPQVRLEVVIDALAAVGHRHPEALQLLAREPAFGMDLLRTVFAEFVTLVDRLLVPAVRDSDTDRFAGISSAELAELVVRIVMSAYLIPASIPEVGDVRSAVSAELFLVSRSRGPVVPAIG
ncbi:TetR/AcrR family transcriptional regulator [Mycolicibacterium sphagni]|uniref:TetR/AcrR family transcriptional regulator n=1 Tax=Mycolicibacterium sphagni TaxID=1786 RepID=UPI0021F353C3|nr:TetR/AcrR family transcriptional regulator [Mycolicibacterium sphagni]MCV7177073.1 TetR family transcriptional regulator [Mycolicibacterium sphagni]